MTTPDEASPYLGKWPRLLVVGQRVTEEQANDIVVRTDSFLAWPSIYGGNDRNWARQIITLLEEFDMPKPWTRTNVASKDQYSYVEHAKLMNVWRKRMAFIDNIDELMNHQVYSSWVGGPHGWCDWSGNIGTSNYNIGKNPDAEDVAGQWELIAQAFPYLDLTAQLVAEDSSLPNNGMNEPAVVQYRVVNGTVTAQYGEFEQLTRPTGDSYLEVQRDVEQILFNGFRERGVDIDRLMAAVGQVHDSYYFNTTTDNTTTDQDGADQASDGQ